jgi:septal ring factor EnvC (AmiA/AmiB activator)
LLERLSNLEKEKSKEDEEKKGELDRLSSRLSNLEKEKSKEEEEKKRLLKRVSELENEKAISVEEGKRKLEALITEKTNMSEKTNNLEKTIKELNAKLSLVCYSLSFPLPVHLCFFISFLIFLRLILPPSPSLSPLLFLLLLFLLLPSPFSILTFSPQIQEEVQKAQKTLEEQLAAKQQQLDNLHQELSEASKNSSASSLERKNLQHDLKEERSQREAAEKSLTDLRVELAHVREVNSKSTSESQRQIEHLNSQGLSLLFFSFPRFVLFF